MDSILTVDDLYLLIGRQAAEIVNLQKQLAQLRAELGQARDQAKAPHG